MYLKGGNHGKSDIKQYCIMLRGMDIDIGGIDRKEGEKERKAQIEREPRKREGERNGNSME